jgi:hypothetical protein
MLGGVRVEPAPEICWQALDSSQVRVIYTARRSQLGKYIPDDLGYLPSPDGRYLLVWDTTSTLVRDGQVAYNTHWLVVKVADGTLTDLGESEQALLLPHWQDSQHVLLEGDITLEGDAAIACFDVATGKLSKPLPKVRWPTLSSASWLENLVAQARLAVYAQRHYAAALECFTLMSGRARGGVAELSDYFVGQLGWFYSDPPEHFILRPIGIPSLGEVDGPNNTRFLYPQAACSADGRAVAYSWIRQQGQPTSSRKGESRGPFAASVDVFLQSASGSWPEEPRRIILAPWERWAPGRDRLAVPGPPPTPRHIQINFRDLRWSWDARYLSFTRHATESAASTYRLPLSSVLVFDALTWEKVMEIPDAQNAFVVPLLR